MIRKCVYAALSLSLVLSTFAFSLASSASAAQLIDTPPPPGLYDRSGIAGTIRYTVPFGARTREKATPYLGLSVTATKNFDSLIGPNSKYSVTQSLADIRFTNKGLRTAKLGGVTMLDAGNASGDVLSGGTILWVVLVAAVAVGVYYVVDGPASTSPAR
ncbi:MAG TPA: hypothetical protein VKA19_11020 [Alphaproteobacteria bacterium]|nr:hypothetical protein [Alphaproteobacteria bacterium]